MKYAIVKNGIVVNVIEYDQQPSTPPAGFEDGYIAIQEDRVNVGFIYANGQFTDPNPPELVEMPPMPTLTDMILSDATELAKLKQALGIA
jgi:hypothetical protein